MVQPASTVVLAALEGSSISSEEAAFFSAHPVSGVTLFSRNIPEDYSNVQQLTQSIQRLRPGGEPPLIVAIDQEGGRVRRIKDPFPDDGPALNLEKGATSAEALRRIKAYGEKVGKELAALGVNVNFAPVVDILTRDDNEAIGDRVFGRDAEAVTTRAGAFLEGMQKASVFGCLKHFPGQGDAPADTHLESATIERSRKQLMEREVVPFAQLLHQAPMVMISHCVYPALDDRPAGLSKVVIQDLLRKELGFAGLVVSDDLLMEAVPQSDTRWQASLIESILAGVDLLLVCKNLRRIELAVKTLQAEARASKTFAQRLEAAAEAVVKFRKKI